MARRSRKEMERVLTKLKKLLSKNKNGVSITTLAKQLKVSERTAFRYVGALKTDIAKEKAAAKAKKRAAPTAQLLVRTNEQGTFYKLVA